eukprot:s2571_g10.t1
MAFGVCELAENGTNADTNFRDEWQPAKMDGSVTMSFSEQREQLLRHWLHEEEMKLRQCAEAEFDTAADLTKALKDIVTEEAALLRRLRLQPRGTRSTRLL